MRIRRWMVLLAVFAILLFVCYQTAFAEYYLVNGTPTIMTVYKTPAHKTSVKHRIHSVYKPCQTKQHHYRARSHASVVVYYYRNPVCSYGCAQGYFDPLVSREMPPVTYSAQPAAWYGESPEGRYSYDDSHYDPDMSTADDEATQHPGMQIN